MLHVMILGSLRESSLGVHVFWLWQLICICACICQGFSVQILICSFIFFSTQFSDVLGRGACKAVYKAFDTQEGTEVAWNQVRVSDLMLGKDASKEDRDRLFAEIRVLKALKHKNIMTFMDSWYDPKTYTVNFITELFTSGTLRQYRRRHKHVDDEVLKRWAWQILCGLVYLHGHNPPIIHRDLKCDNIFINGSDGVVKIGDLGLATMLRAQSAPQSVLGTPEFMAPELYEEEYDDRVDVYSYGMALLELATLEYPYSECKNAAQIYRKVSLGVRPAGLQKIQSHELAEFINLCISPRNQRPRSRQLLKHPYFDSIRKTLAPSKSEISLANAAADALIPHAFGMKRSIKSTSSSLERVAEGMGDTDGESDESIGSSKAGPKSSFSCATSTAEPGSINSDTHSVHSQKSNASEMAAALGSLDILETKSPFNSRTSSRPISPMTSPPEALSPQKPGSPSGKSDLKDVGLVDSDPSIARRIYDSDYVERDAHLCHCAATDRCFQVKSRYRETEDHNLLSLRLKIKEPDDLLRTVEFQFDMKHDTAVSVASEMVADLELSPEDAEIIAEAMNKEISTLSENLEGKASQSLAETAVALQRGLRDSAMMVANSAELTGNEDTEDTVSGPYHRLRNVEEGGCQLQTKKSSSSLHSELSAASLHSVESSETTQSSRQGSNDIYPRPHLPSPFPVTAAPSATQPLSRSLSMEEDEKQNAFSSHGSHPSVANCSSVSLADKNKSTTGVLSPPSGVLSPLSTSGAATHGQPDKRSLSKLFENLQQIASERAENSTPPPVSGRPPLPPQCAGGKLSGQIMRHDSKTFDLKNSASAQNRSLITMRSVPASFSGNYQLPHKDNGSKDSEACTLGSRPSLSDEIKGRISNCSENGVVKKTAMSGTAGKDKEMLRKQAADAMKQVEIRSLTCLQGSFVSSGKSTRGTPMMAVKTAKTMDSSGMHTLNNQIRMQSLDLTENASDGSGSKGICIHDSVAMPSKTEHFVGSSSEFPRDDSSGGHKIVDPTTASDHSQVNGITGIEICQTREEEKS